MGSKKEKIESVSVLRLFFISLILLTHFREYLGYDFFAGLFFKNGLTPLFAMVGVSGFFVISGFVLTYSYLPRKDLNLSQFYFKRFVRFIPLYYIVVLLHIVPIMYISIGNALSHVFLVNVFFPSFSRNPGSIWFVSTIFQFYLIFPFFLKLLKNAKVSILMASAFFGYLIGQFMIAYAGLYLQDSVVNFLPDFCVGMWIAAKKDEFLENRLVVFLSLTVCIFISFAFKLTPLVENPLISEIVTKSFALSTVLLIFWLTYLSTLNVRISTKILSFGDAVVCVFLFHRLVWMIMLGIWNPTNFALRFIYLAVLGIPCIFILSELLQRSYAKFLVKHGLTDLCGLKIFFRKARLL